MIRKPVLFATLASVVGAVGLLAASGAQENKQEEKKPLAPEKYKNIKVLKTLPAAELGSLMHKINDALGVNCDFCHVVETTADGKHVGWEKDDKRMKEVARQMILMTGNLNANEKSVKKKITCFTCHHGKHEPENAPRPADKDKR